MNTIDELLKHREAKGLSYTALTRICLSLFGIIALVAGNTPNYDITMFIVIWGVTIVVNSGFIWYLPRVKHFLFLGVMGVVFDIVALSLIPGIWYKMTGEGFAPIAFFMKFPITMFCFLSIAINSLAMKPLYPTLVTLGILLLHVYYFNLVLADPLSQFSQDLAAVVFGSAISIELYFNGMVMIFLTGGTLVFLTHLARKIVFEAVRMEQENTTIREHQARLIMETKMDSLKRLVAGFVHEVNTPVGAVNSGMDTAARGLQKIKEVIGESETVEELKRSAPLLKSFQIMNLANQSIKSAVDRINTIVISLKSFVRLDEAGFQMADVHEGLDSTLTLMAHEFKDRITLVKQYGHLPEIACHPADINQVISNVLANAIQAIPDHGTITIQTEVEDTHVLIRVTDTGVGIAQEHLKQIFDPSFTRTELRVKTKLGLFTCYNIIQNHHGDLQVESKPDEGTTVTVHIPIGLEREAVNA